MNNRNLELWLKQKNKHVFSIYEDPEYSNYYKSYFGSYVDETFYSKNDIDIKITPQYFENIYDNNYDEIEQFIDYIPRNVPQYVIDTATHGIYGNEKKNIIEKLERKCLLIPPGTNHSNVNFLYKLMMDNIIDIKAFNIPYVSNNINEQYKGIIKEEYMNINKLDLYNFAYKNSIIK